MCWCKWVSEIVGENNQSQCVGVNRMGEVVKAIDHSGCFST